jgi:hypothetical protein
MPLCMCAGVPHPLCRVRNAGDISQDLTPLLLYHKMHVLIEIACFFGKYFLVYHESGVRCTVSVRKD